MSAVTGNEFLIEAVDDPVRWRSLLETAGLHSLYNGWSWTTYKAAKGWQVTRLHLGNPGGSTAAVCVAQVRAWGPLRLVLLQGGLKSLSRTEEQFTALLSAVLGHLRLSSLDCLLLRFHEPEPELCTRGLLRLGLLPQVNNRMFSLFFECRDGLVVDESRLTGNWRHNLKRALKNDALSLRWCETPAERAKAVDAMDIMYKELARRKGFPASIDVAKIRDSLIEDPAFLIVSAVVEGEAVAVRIAYRESGSLLDFLAASNDKAVKTYANYLLVWQFILKCKVLGLRGFECGGIDPAGNPGVYNFKKGLGATLTLNGPLWVYCKASWLGRLVRLALVWSA